jgi:homogentisate 1,2-dioxygenase
MSEFSGVISGGFDVSKVPKPMWGMCGLNNSVSPHGLSKEEVELAMTKKLEPERIPDDHVGFLFESCFQIGITDWALQRAIPTNRRPDFGGFQKFFKGSKI